MRVTRLEIFGFKSFVERFVLNFDQNLIGIVGPNGCGKSNVVDALRWVLGETYAKQLRGNVFDDLIFNGSDSRRPLGMAEVSITIRPQEGWQDMTAVPATNEPAVVPISAVESEEPIEGEQAEEEGEALNGAAPHAEAAVDSELLNPQPNILSEIPGLLGAAEIQFTRRLYRSGESEYFINRVPCRLRDMTDIYRLIGLGARGLSIVQQGEIGELISKKPIERRELLEEAAGISGFRTRMEAAQRKLERTGENMARLNDIIVEVDKQVRVLQRQARRAKDRSEIRAELRQYDLDLFHGRSARISAQRTRQREIQENLESELERVRSELTLSEANQMELQAQLESFEVQLSDKRRERDTIQQVLDSNRARIADLRLEIALAAERIATVQKAGSRADDRKSALEREIGERLEKAAAVRAVLAEKSEHRSAAESQLLELQASGAENSRRTEIRNEIAKLNAELEQMPVLESRLKSAEADVRAKEAELRRAEADAQDTKLRLNAVRTEVDSLKQQLDALAEHVVKAAMSDETSSLPGLNRVLLAGLRANAEFQPALTAVLGERGQYLLTSSAFELGTAFAKRTERGAKKIGVIDQSYRPASAPDLTPEERAVAPSARFLLDVVDVEAGFDAAASTFLGAMILVDNLEEALALRSVAESPRSMVTLSGELVMPWGWCTTEGKGMAFSFTNRIAEKERAGMDIAAQLAEREQRISEVEASLESAREAVQERRSERERLIVEQRRLVTLRSEEGDIERALAKQEREAQELLRKMIAELSGLEHEAKFGEKKALELESEIASLDEQAVSRLEEIRALQEKHAQLEQTLRDGDEGGVDLGKLQETARALEESIRALDQERNPIRMKLAEESESVAQVRREVSQFQDQFNKSVLEIEKCELELKMLHDDIVRTYADIAPASETEIEAVLIRAGGEIERFVDEAQEEAGKIRRRIEREGEVDPQSIELYEQEDARLQGMRAQFADLESATEILERTIRQLKEVSRTRFIETFEAVSTKFSELVPRLFGGGAGQLQLVNPDDPLTSGVEIFVRPPGKKIANMELLSGGEKALVATAVLISMFLHRPSPICVLDEVDAPLDEANLERYLGLISEIAHNTQFLVITHNKRTMAEADRLIGITMQEKGVSTALTVTLDESEEEIDRLIANA